MLWFFIVIDLLVMITQKLLSNLTQHIHVKIYTTEF